MSLQILEIATDGFKNYLQLPTGKRYSLGAVPPLKFVRQLGLGEREMRRIFDEFNDIGRVAFRADVERALLALGYRKTAANLLIDTGKQVGIDTMVIPDDLADEIVATLDQLEAVIGKSQKYVTALIEKIRRPLDIPDHTDLSIPVDLEDTAIRVTQACQALDSAHTPEQIRKVVTEIANFVNEG